MDWLKSHTDQLGGLEKKQHIKFISMNKLKNILTEITRLTYNIETNYPELYRNLDENPMTIPATNHPQINKEVMQDYLESLKQILKHYLETHKNK